MNNQGVLGRILLKKACLLADTRSKKMYYFGHIIRHSTLQQDFIRGENRRQVQPGRDRPKAMWKGNITEWSGLVHMEATRKAHDGT